MSLTFEQPDPTAAYIKNIILYGEPGQGKSTAAASAPGPLLYLNAEGPSRLRFARAKYGDEKFHEVRVTGKETLDEAYLHLRNGGGEKTAIVDTVGEVRRIVLEELAKDSAHITLPEHGEANTILARFTKALMDLDVNVVLVCHTDMIQSSDGEVIHRPMTGGQQLPGLLSGRVDVVAYCKAITGDQGEVEYVAQLVAGNGRQAKWSGPSLGAVRKPDLSEWLTASAAAGNPAKEG